MHDQADASGGPVAHTDGSCLGTPGPGGWGVHIEFPDGRVLELGGGEGSTTNNRMELRAAIEAARAVAGHAAATIITDSQYVRRGITEWLSGWKRKGWTTATGQPVLNRDLWEELDQANGPDIDWQWTRGHAGDPGNERCDEIAGWFANGVRSVTRGRRTPAFAPPSVSSASPSSSRGPARGGKPGVTYLSLIDGILKRHATWPECEARVRGVGGARYKKVQSPAEERDVLQRWGVTSADLFGVE